MTTSILLDPRFLDPGRDYRPAEGSPCIDAGDNTVIDRAAEEDLAGQTRFRDDPRTANTGPADGPTIDIGGAGVPAASFPPAHVRP